MTKSVSDESRPQGSAVKASEATESAIIEAVRSIRYGSVEIVVHDGVVVQIESRRKIRFERRG